MKKYLIAGIIAVIGIGATAQEPLNYIETRQAIMKYIGGQMRTLGGMQQGQIEFNAQYVSSTGGAIETLAMSFPLLFPKGTKIGENTKAGQAIFDNPNGFQVLTSQLALAGSEMKQATSQEELQSAFAKVSGTCRTCHTQYRN